MKNLNIFKTKTAKTTFTAVENLTSEQMMLINGGTTDATNETAMNAIRPIR